jgi:hypothetical protein
MSRTIKQKKTGGKAVSHNCRNNGTCPYCTDNRLHKNNKRIQATNNNLILIK